MPQTDSSTAIARIRNVAKSLGLDALLSQPLISAVPDLECERTTCQVETIECQAVIDRERFGAIKRFGAETISLGLRTRAGREKCTAFLLQQPDTHYVTIVCRQPPRRKLRAVSIQSAEKFTRLQAIRNAERELRCLLSMAKQEYA